MFGIDLRLSALAPGLLRELGKNFIVVILGPFAAIFLLFISVRWASDCFRKYGKETARFIVRIIGVGLLLSISVGWSIFQLVGKKRKSVITA